jgi:peptidoglycan hydrolase-like protein with peptidoglycan-binding domain
MEGINSTLSRGSTGEQVKALQQYLIGLGYSNVKADGVFGPVTEAAVKQFQFDNGLKGDGIFGPISKQKALAFGTTGDQSGVPGSGKAPDDPTNMFNTSTGELNPKFVPKTQKELDAYYNASVLSNPVFAGNAPEALEYAAMTGDFNSLVDHQGKPFSDKIQNEAMSAAEKALAPGFEAEKKFDTADIESDLARKTAGYEDFLAGEKIGFDADKTALDQDAADKGVLFSGGRIEREKSLKNIYEMNQEQKRRELGASIGDISRGYQYQYGDEAANSPMLSRYYQAGGNAYNPKVARGGATPTALSSIYSSSPYGLTGSKVRANKVAVAGRAANLLSNRANKLVGSGYQNQF